MAIARDTHGKSNGGTDTGKTISLTLASGAVLAVGVGQFNGTILAPSSVTWNGTNLTLITKIEQTIGSIYIYWLGNPTSGTHNLVSTFSGSVYNDMFGISYLGASTSTPTSFDAQFNASGSSISNTLDNSNNAWYFGVANGGPSQTGVTNATVVDSDGTGGFQSSYDSNGAASSTTMTVSRSGSGTIELASFAIPEPGSSSSTVVTPNLPLLHVG